jgi:hypothetical protein
VPFQQLFYTSCERGLGGYDGYQFNAVTPGVPPAVLREVEERTVYEPPPWLGGPDQNEPGAYPVAFSHGMSDATGASVTSHVVFTGTDYSGRPGNYFVHALVTSTPELDFGPLFPAELWGAALWQSTPSAGTELPELPGPPSPGVIDRPRVQAFLDARKAESVLPELLTAVGRALAGERPVLVVTEDATENARWIAAVSYLLGKELARRLTFTTYSRRPGYSRYHVTGALAGTVPSEADASFQVFDFTTGRTPGDMIHPLPAILTSTGVMAASGLWQQAVAFASGTEDSLDAWLAPAVAAAGLLGRRLSAEQAGVVADWLPAAVRWMPSELADVAFGVVLAQPAGTLSGGRLHELLDLARQLPAPPRVEQLERMLAERAIAGIARDDPVAPVLLSGSAVQAARELATEMLDTAPLARALAVLEWTAASGVTLADEDLERFGQTRLGAGLPEQELAGLAGFHPAIRRGLLERLAGEPPEAARAVLGGPAGTQFKQEDLAGHPELAELWLLQTVARGQLRPLRAFDQITDIREAAQRSPRIDAATLRLLWPDGCPPEDLAELLGVVIDPPPAEVLAWFTAQLTTISARGTTSPAWSGLATVLAGHPILGMVPDLQASSVRNTIRVLPLLQRAQLEGPHGKADVFAGLFGEYTTADGDTRRLLERELPALVARARPLTAALRGCPDDLTAPLCRELDARLGPAQPDTALARQVFAATGHPEVLARPVLSERLAAVLEQVGRWSGHDLGVLAHSLDDDAELAQSFRKWRQARRSGRTRRLFGGGGPQVPGR